jgi:hypothetical protein
MTTDEFGLQLRSEIYSSITLIGKNNDAGSDTWLEFSRDRLPHSALFLVKQLPPGSQLGLKFNIMKIIPQTPISHAELDDRVPIGCWAVETW